MLPAGATGAIGVDLQIALFDVDLNRLVDFRRDEYAGERCMPSRCLIEWRNAHEAMHADLASQQAKGILTIYGESRRLDASFLRSLIIVEHGLETFALGPAQVHAHEHFCPVL